MKQNHGSQFVLETTPCLGPALDYDWYTQCNSIEENEFILL